MAAELAVEAGSGEDVKIFQFPDGEQWHKTGSNGIF